MTSAITVSPATQTTPKRVLVYNNTGSTLNPGSLCDISGWNTGSAIPQVTLSSNIVAGLNGGLLVVDSIASGASGHVVECDQVVTGINVGAASVGDAVFLGTDGGYVFTTAPAGPARTQRVGVVVSTGGSGSIYLFPTELHTGS